MALSILPGHDLRVEAFAPTGLVREQVEGYWRLEVREPPASVQLIPDGLIDLTFDTRLGQAFVTGPLMRGTSYTHQHPTVLLGASLRPGTAVALLGASAAALAAEWQPLATAIGAAAEPLAGLVFAASNVAGQLAILDAFFLARAFATSQDERVRRAVQAIVASDGEVDIEGLASHAGASPRNLGRLFDEWVGMPPKRFARIVRLQAVLRRLSDDPTAPLATVAADAGYADQSHLTREMQALGGITPRTLSEFFKR